jgi:ligand-binding sensor domain-containing protein
VATSLLAGDPEVRRLVVGLAGSGQGTLRSEDGGATWAGLGSPAIGRVDALAGDPAGVLYAATDRGVWRLSH